MRPPSEYTDARGYRSGKEHWKGGGLPVTAEEPAAVQRRPMLRA